MLYLLAASLALHALEAVKISVDGKDIPALYNPVDEGKGSVILIQGQQPRQNNIVAFLSTHFPNKQWSTLSITQAVDGALLAKLIPQAARFMSNKKSRRIIVLYYGKGGDGVLNYFAKAKTKLVSGVVLLSAYSLQPKPVESLAKMEMPIYDVSAQFDYPLVLEQSKKRSMDIKDRYYSSFKVPGAKHSYVDVEPVLMAWLRGWMQKQKLRPSKPKNRPPRRRRR